MPLAKPVLGEYVGDYALAPGATTLGPCKLANEPLRVLLFDEKPFMHLPGVGDMIGGYAELLRNPSEIVAAVGRICDDLQSQYLLTFEGQNEGFALARTYSRGLHCGPLADDKEEAMRAFRLVTIVAAVIGTQGALVSQPLPDRPSIVSSTYWGGSLQEDSAGIAVAVDAAGHVYIAGTTYSTDFQTTINALPALGSGDVFISKFDATGTLVFSTTFGGSSSEMLHGLAVDSGGNIVVVGNTYSGDLPMVNPIQPAFHPANCSEFGGLCPDGFVARIDPTGSSLLFSTYFGGNRFDQARDVAVDAVGSMYVIGEAETVFDGVPSHRPFGGTRDAFVAKIPSQGGALGYFTYLGGSSSDQGNGIAVDTTGHVYVTGTTGSQDFPVANAIQPTQENFSDSGFVTKLSPAGAIAYSTYLGGQSQDSGIDIAIDGSGSAHVVGITASTNFPMVNAQQPFLRGPSDVFVAKLHPSGSSLEYSTYLGGQNREQLVLDLSKSVNVIVDEHSHAYVAGTTQSSDFPEVDGFQAFGGGTCMPIPFRTEPCPDAFLSKLDDRGRLIFSTPIGGGNDDRGRGIGITPGFVYVAGGTKSVDFPLADALDASLSGSSDAFLTKISFRPPACQLSAPVQLAPSGGVFVHQPTFSWQPVAEADAYTVIIGDLAEGLLTGTPSAQVLGTTSTTSLTPSAAMPEGDYAWFVVASSATCGRGQQSAGMAFTIPGFCPAPPAAPTSPVGGVIVNNPVQLEWTKVGPSFASLYIVTILRGDGRLLAQYPTSDTSFTVPTTLATGEYQWVVFSWNSTCGFTGSPPAAFTIQ